MSGMELSYTPFVVLFLANGQPIFALSCENATKTTNMKIACIFLVSVFFPFAFICAQSISPAVSNMGGGYQNAGYYQFEFSVGEMAVIETLNNGSNILTNGVLQPLTDKPFGNNTASAWNNDEIKIFPVPTRGRVEVNILSKQQGRIVMQLVDGMGQIVLTEDFDYNGLGSITVWDLSRLASANYSLRIALTPRPGSVKKSGAFKILKIN
jgi:hypothetical protein